MYSLKRLPFTYESLEPYIDTHTLALHHLKHQASYLNNLNMIIDKYNLNYEIDTLYKHLDEINKDDINNVIYYLGGVLNHDIYWETINPHNKEEPRGKLLDAIIKQYSSMDSFWEEFLNLSLNLKGSGYVFLIKDNDTVKLMTTKNQDNPLLYGYTPLLTLDLWEHAYYLNYKNDKEKYFDNFKSIVNFRYANNTFTNN